MSGLSVSDHRRDRAGMTYVYPVLSRRSGGVSLGINLNPNHACNWRCLYCQVENLQRGSAPVTDLQQLEAELSELLAQIACGDFYDRHGVVPAQRRLCDLAISGNGEPTSAAAFPQVVALIGRVLGDVALPGAASLRRVLISNGSHVLDAAIAQALMAWAQQGGELWFKLDGVAEADVARINSVHTQRELAARRLMAALEVVPTWVQTCHFLLDGQAAMSQPQAWWQLLGSVASHPNFRGVLLYGPARPSNQPEAGRIRAPSLEALEALALPLREQGITVQITP